MVSFGLILIVVCIPGGISLISNFRKRCLILWALRYLGTLDGVSFLDLFLGVLEVNSRAL